MKDEIQSIVKDSFDEAVNTIKKLIDIKGFSGTEKDRADYIIEKCKTFGYDDVNIDKRGNVIAKVILGTGDGPSVVLTGHLDTVWADENEWDKLTPPFKSIIKDNNVYGRGAADMLGSVGIMIHILRELKKKINDNLNGIVYFVGTVCEEFFEGVCLLEVLKDINPDYIIIGEATDCKINIGQRGRAELVITAYGRSVHASNGRSAQNAIEQTASVINVFHRSYIPQKDELLGERVIVPTDIKIPIGGGGGLDGRGGNSTVPNKVELTYDLRLLEGDTEEFVKTLIQDELYKNNCDADKDKYDDFKSLEINLASDGVKTYTGIMIEQNKFAPAWKTDRDSVIVSKSIKGLQRGGFDSPEIGSYRFCTDGSAVIAYRRHNPDSKVEIIGFGPGKESYAHIKNEFIELEAIENVFKGYLGICIELLK